MFILLLLFIFFIPSQAFSVVLEIPLDCQIGKDCFIQNYLDTEFGDRYKDFRCGSLSYDKHKGTDFRLPNLVAMKKGVSVLAAAEGVVLRIRDGIDDNSSASVVGKECGNGVIISHDDDYETQYCHMKKGSISVYEGQKVVAGEKLGLIGLSGRTVFPHLHLSVRHKNIEVDPFTGDAVESHDGKCSIDENSTSLWKEPIEYIPTALLSMGFAPEAGIAEKARNGEYSDNNIDKNSPAIVVWVDIMGVQSGDILKIELNKPDMVTRIFENHFNSTKAQIFHFSGVKLKSKSWKSGVYSGKATLYRNRDKVFEQTKEFTIE